MAQHGAYAKRNAAHKARQAQLLAQADNDWERLQVVYDWLRSSLRLLQRRRQPLGTSRGMHEAQAEQLVCEAVQYLQNLVARIDSGEFDAAKEEV